MAKNPENVKSFLETLSSQLQTLWKKEREVILKYKEEEFKVMGRKFDGKINAEDFWYYITAIQEKEFSVDQEQLKEYFPIDVVTKGMMDIYQRLLSLTFSKVEGIPVWHPEVELYKVDDIASKETIGFFFLDLCGVDTQTSVSIRHHSLAVWQQRLVAFVCHNIYRIGVFVPCTQTR